MAELASDAEEGLHSFVNGASRLHEPGVEEVGGAVRVVAVILTILKGNAQHVGENVGLVVLVSGEKLIPNPVDDGAVFVQHGLGGGILLRAVLLQSLAHGAERHAVVAVRKGPELALLTPVAPLAAGEDPRNARASGLLPSSLDPIPHHDQVGKEVGKFLGGINAFEMLGKPPDHRSRKVLPARVTTDLALVGPLPYQPSLKISLVGVGGVLGDARPLQVDQHLRALVGPHEAGDVALSHGNALLPLVAGQHLGALHDHVAVDAQVALVLGMGQVADLLIHLIPKGNACRPFFRIVKVREDLPRLDGSRKGQRLSRGQVVGNFKIIGGGEAVTAGGVRHPAKVSLLTAECQLTHVAGGQAVGHPRPGALEHVPVLLVGTVGRIALLVLVDHVLFLPRSGEQSQAVGHPLGRVVFQGNAEIDGGIPLLTRKGLHSGQHLTPPLDLIDGKTIPDLAVLRAFIIKAHHVLAVEEEKAHAGLTHVNPVVQQGQGQELEIGAQDGDALRQGAVEVDLGGLGLLPGGCFHDATVLFTCEGAALPLFCLHCSTFGKELQEPPGEKSARPCVFAKIGVSISYLKMENIHIFCIFR